MIKKSRWIMKKIGLALLLLLFTGCTILRVDERSFDSIINTVLYKDTNLINLQIVFAYQLSSTIRKMV